MTMEEMTESVEDGTIRGEEKQRSKTWRGQGTERIICILSKLPRIKTELSLEKVTARQELNSSRNEREWPGVCRWLQNEGLAVVSSNVKRFKLWEGDCLGEWSASSNKEHENYLSHLQAQWNMRCGRKSSSHLRELQRKPCLQGTNIQLGQEDEESIGNFADDGPWVLGDIMKFSLCCGGKKAGSD